MLWNQNVDLVLVLEPFSEIVQYVIYFLFTVCLAHGYPAAQAHCSVTSGLLAPQK